MKRHSNLDDCTVLYSGSDTGALFKFSNAYYSIEMQYFCELSMQLSRVLYLR
jgi:hypothetical protein